MTAPSSVGLPIFSDSGRFEPKALDVLATSSVVTEPDMQKLPTEAYLPK